MQELCNALTGRNFLKRQHFFLKVVAENFIRCTIIIGPNDEIYVLPNFKPEDGSSPKFSRKVKIQ